MRTNGQHNNKKATTLYRQHWRSRVQFKRRLWRNDYWMAYVFSFDKQVNDGKNSSTVVEDACLKVLTDMRFLISGRLVFIAQSAMHAAQPARPILILVR